MEQVLLNGLVVGTTYALIALGITIIFSIMNVVNFAHGQLYMIGGLLREFSVWFSVLAWIGRIIFCCRGYWHRDGTFSLPTSHAED